MTFTINAVFIRALLAIVAPEGGERFQVGGKDAPIIKIMEDAVKDKGDQFIDIEVTSEQYDNLCFMLSSTATIMQIEAVAIKERKPNPVTSN